MVLPRHEARRRWSKLGWGVGVPADPVHEPWNSTVPEASRCISRSTCSNMIFGRSKTFQVHNPFLGSIAVEWIGYRRRERTEPCPNPAWPQCTNRCRGFMGLHCWLFNCTCCFSSFQCTTWSFQCAMMCNVFVGSSGWYSDEIPRTIPATLLIVQLSLWLRAAVYLKYERNYTNMIQSVDAKLCLQKPIPAPVLVWWNICSD